MAGGLHGFKHEYKLRSKSWNLICWSAKIWGLPFAIIFLYLFERITYWSAELWGHPFGILFLYLVWKNNLQNKILKKKFVLPLLFLWQKLKKQQKWNKNILLSSFFFLFSFVYFSSFFPFFSFRFSFFFFSFFILRFFSLYSFLLSPPGQIPFFWSTCFASFSFLLLYFFNLNFSFFNFTPTPCPKSKLPESSCSFFCRRTDGLWIEMAMGIASESAE